MQIISALAAGLLFGLGLIVSRMIDPAKVLGFLDLFGNWDPSLAFVMASAVLMSALAYVLAKRLGKPVFAPAFDLPGRRDLDPPLVAGSAMFGIGWGLVGLCPGPALAVLPLGYGETAIFVVAMLAGMSIHAAATRIRAAAAPGPSA
jgi:uncharacterized membrane protein YedE/YeeE